MTRRRRRTAATPPPPAPAGVFFDRSTLTAIGIVLLVWWLATPARRPTPAEERPVVAWVVRTAKSLLWIAAFAERPPTAPEEHVEVRHDTGVDGFPLVDHGRGW